jgi:hypothetical protein
MKTDAAMKSSTEEREGGRKNLTIFF